MLQLRGDEAVFVLESGCPNQGRVIMLHRRHLLAAFACAIGLVLTGGWDWSFANGEEFTQQQFEQLHAELQHGDAPWRTIPWKIDLLDAQRTAAAGGKPIFIWAMDGHPLGCT